MPGRTPLNFQSRFQSFCIGRFQQILGNRKRTEGMKFYQKLDREGGNRILEKFLAGLEHNQWSRTYTQLAPTKRKKRR
jgi:hypothetical protein